MTWLRATMIRVIRTGAQAALASMAAAVAFTEVQWDEVAGVTGLAMIVAFLMALAGLPETTDKGPLERGDGGQSIIVVAAVSAVVCFIILLLTDVIHIN